MTYSRSSWLGLALAAVIFLALMDWRFLPAMLVVGGCAIPFLPRSILNRILTIGNMKDSSARYRIAIYEDTARLLKDYGVTGVGLGSDVTAGCSSTIPLSMTETTPSTPTTIIFRCGRRSVSSACWPTWV